ncbi:hypothetical protein A2U01_0002793 [Trifolium medium]|uniref:Transposase (putative) gypsy type domain-containing protein n=1 Tax=Trifolium medium TaxID=97028 RepID=A0A392M5J5_9FABA|nr:hypothetical protein [Trifolium medium]
MYEFAFKELGFRLPFSDLAVGVFEWLRLAPSQLHLNSLAFIRAFEIVCEHLEVEPTLPVFFRVFKLQCQPAKNGKHGWVSLKQQIKLFRMFTDSVRGFKERYFVVKLIMPSTIDSLYKTVVVTAEDGAAQLDENGEQITRRVHRFPLKWTRRHFDVSTDSYLTKDETLSDAEQATKLKAFVKAFKPVRYMTKMGEPVYDSHGRERVEARHINTRALLEAKSKAEHKILLDNMANFADELMKIVADQKAPKRGKKKVKSRASLVLEQFGPGGSSSPGGVSSSQVRVQTSSPVVRQLPPKRQREDSIVDLDPLEQSFPLPRSGRQDELVQDAATLMRLLETALVLNDEKSSAAREIEKLNATNEKLEAKIMKLEGEAIDLLGKQKNYAAHLQENRVMKVALDKAVKELEELKSGHAEERKKLEDTIEELKSRMMPADDETESTRDLATRVELVARVKKLGGEVFNGVKYGWDNALAQLQVVNPDIKFNTEGMGVLPKVENGQIVIPDKYKQMEIEAQEEDDVEEDDDDVVEEEEHDGREEGHGESDG